MFHDQFDWGKFLATAWISPSLAAIDANEDYDHGSTAIAIGAGFIGSAIAQGVSGASTASFGAAASTSISTTGAVVGAVAGSTTSQLLNLALDRQDKFSWGGVAAAAVGSYLGSQVGATAHVNGQALYQPQAFTWSGLAARAITNMVLGSVSRFVQIAIDQEGEFDFAQVAADAFGNALGNSIVGHFELQAQLDELGPAGRETYDRAREEGDSAQVALERGRYADQHAFQEFLANGLPVSEPEQISFDDISGSVFGDQAPSGESWMVAEGPSSVQTDMPVDQGRISGPYSGSARAEVRRKNAEFQSPADAYSGFSQDFGGAVFGAQQASQGIRERTKDYVNRSDIFVGDYIELTEAIAGPIVKFSEGYTFPLDFTWSTEASLGFNGPQALNLDAQGIWASSSSVGGSGGVLSGIFVSLPYNSEARIPEFSRLIPREGGLRVFVHDPSVATTYEVTRGTRGRVSVEEVEWPTADYFE